ncbi:adhesion G protein-coupled receptor F5 isoform X2 [Perognathus longimembris pacificus]|nr:adhesion G protein-coupled receptor F5 isoform X2 [Perognathus longimembris pacificus]XP_048203611.1 adhesion G protein-coupled receptor F5 isoform X2 [Perognathus longimembris pacificus]
MKSRRRTTLCFMFIVIYSSRAARDLNPEPAVHPLVLQERELEGEGPLRQKRAAIQSPAVEDYTVDVEIRVENASVLESLRARLDGLRFPIRGNHPDSAADILSIAVTTVCRPTADEVWCSCEAGYRWPGERCLRHPACHRQRGHVLSGPHCTCLKGLPPGGPFCQLPEGYVTLKMRVRLNVGFQEDLKNTSSALYRSYKTDLERAFREGYRILPGFQSVAVTGFTKGSVVVNYEVKTTTPPSGFIQTANENVMKNLNKTYRMDDGSFQGVPSNETKFTITPELIIEGDSVTLQCENDVLSPNVSWHYGENRSEIQNSSKFLIYNEILNMTSVSRLTIYNFTQSDAGDYACKLLMDIFEFGTSRKVSAIPVRIWAKEEIKVMCDNNPVTFNCCSENNGNWSKVEWKQEGKISIVGISETDLESSCSMYTVKANGTQCPSGSVGTTVTYTCEFISSYGARGSKNINVTFVSVGDNSSHKGEVPEVLRHAMEVSTVQSTTWNSLETNKAQEQQANLTITPDPISVSEGQSFSIKCSSDMSNYDEVYWNTSAGIRLHQRFFTVRQHPAGAESVLTVRTATREWNGTYHCIFRYKDAYSVATKDVTIHPLPLEIMMDPLEASSLCAGSHCFKCCVEEDEDYSVTFQVDSSFFPAVKEVRGKQVCYKYNLQVKPVPTCPKTIDVFCHFTNAANYSVQSPPMKLTLVPGENVTCRDPLISVGEPGKIIQKLCQFSQIPRSSGSVVGGTVTYKCVGSQWREERKNCISAPIYSLLRLAKALIKSPSQDQKLPTYLKDLSVSTGKEKKDIHACPGNLGAIVNILNLVSTVLTQVNLEMMRDLLSILNVILDTSSLNTWQKLLDQQSNRSSQLLHSVERFSQALQLGDSAPLSLSHPNVQMKSMVLTRGHPKIYQQQFVFPDSDLWGDVVIDECQLGSLPPESPVVTVAFPTLKAMLAQATPRRAPASSLVMTTTVSRRQAAAPFGIAMTFKSNHYSREKPQCVFWNFSLANHTGGWDPSGCYVKEVRGDRVSCYCDHLTSFSILMSPDSPDPDSLMKILLDIISYIGLGFSILSLAACLGVEATVWKAVTKNRTSYMRHVCIVNIAASLLVADAWFIVAAALQDYDAPLNRTACVAATFFIHFFYLSVFFWMLTLGLMLFYRLVFILHDASKSTQKALAFSLGYVCPLAIALITLGATQPRDAYTRRNACWLNWEDTKALLAFVVPALVIVVVNLTITAVVITKILRPSIGDRPSKPEKSGLLQIGKSVGVLTPLLGLTWGFGLATVFQGSNAVFHIVFTLLNAFQGLFILLFGCLWDQKVQEALLNKFSLSRWSSQHSKSTSLGSSTPVFSMSSPISRRFNNLFGKTGTYNVSTPETTSSSVENSSSAYSLLN